ncbi:Nucleolar protein 12 [Mortierella polycephala]|uniref:Nucleolar protein 12 n=1 Tax=Mortierella polycephala TaxID=41804 RepID=A0A9P6PKR2_9FUNG|nr:Nucleolar protein 12 [Mortierella polycephala]
MSLTAALLKGKSVENSLDSLFKNSAGPSKVQAPIPAKVRQPYPEDLPEQPKKKNKTPKPKSTPISKKNKKAAAQDSNNGDANQDANDEDEDEDEEDEDVEENNAKKNKKGKVSVEAKYEAKKAAAETSTSSKNQSKKTKEAPKETKDLIEQQTKHDYGEDVEMEESKVEDLVHESLRKNNNKRKVEPASEEAKDSKKAKTTAGSTKDRSSKEKASGDSDDEDASPDTNKDGTKKSDDSERQARTVFVGNLAVSSMTKGDFKKLKSTFAAFGSIESIRFRSIAFSELLPRKIAFITGKLHPDRDVVNAYIVYTTKGPVAKAVTALNGQSFLNKHIRVDTLDGAKQHQPKKSVFVGNLAFDAQEEDLWNFFKDSGDIENVRIIRDKKTNLGKGFAYVQFQDRASVDVALRLHETKMGTRKLRVVRCKRLEDDNTKTNGMGPRSTTAVARSDKRDLGKDGKVAKPQHAPIKLDGASKRLAFKERKTKERHILTKKKTGGIVEGERSQKGAKVDLGIKKGKTKVKANVPKKKVTKK